jgi:hypothetical protein
MAMTTSATGPDLARERWFFEDPGAADTVPLVAPYRVRVAPMAVVSLILGVIAVCATLTGLLAAVGVVIGALAAAAAVTGLLGARRYDRTGRGLAVIGLVCGMGAATIAVLAIGGHLSWLSSHRDEVGQVYDWLVTRLPWLARWDS